MFEVLVETEDKSVYSDRLKELTGKPRNYWTRLPLRALKELYRKEIQRKRGDSS